MKKLTTKQLLLAIEYYIDNADPDEKDKRLMTLYRWVHSHNRHSCKHLDWQKEAYDGYNILKKHYE